MLIYILFIAAHQYNTNSLRAAIKERWSDANVNMMGTFGKTDSFTRYQVQIDRDIIYHSNSVTDNTTIINLIEERL